MTDDLERRVGDLELAVLALAVEEFGDLPGHPFRGNQHTGGTGTSKDDAIADQVYGVGAKEMADARAEYEGRRYDGANKDDALNHVEDRFGRNTARALEDEVARRDPNTVTRGRSLEKMTPGERSAHYTGVGIFASAEGEPDGGSS